MITASFHLEGSRIVSFQVEGHSGLAQAGEDILCAAVNDVLGLEASVKVRPEKALISLKLPGGLSQQNESTCQTLLTGLMVYLTQLFEEYPDNIIVMEV